MSPPSRAVFDCNVLLQALISPQGPSGKLLHSAKGGKLTLYVSQYVLDELREVTARPKVARKFRLTPEVVSRFCDELIGHATLIDTVPHVFDFPRDPDDAHYIDLAVAANAALVVSRDHDLLSLRDVSTEAGRDFAAQFPSIEILTPPEALRRLETSDSK